MSTIIIVSRRPRSIRQDFLPEQFWNDCNERNATANAFLTGTVTNPFRMTNRLSGNTFFTSGTIRRNRRLRAAIRQGAALRQGRRRAWRDRRRMAGRGQLRFARARWSFALDTLRDLQASDCALAVHR